MMNQATTNAGQVIAIKEPRAYSDIMESARIVKMESRFWLISSLCQITKHDVQLTS